MTIAYICNLVYKTLYLESERVSIIPPHGYRPEQKQSIKAVHWLRYISKRNDINIQHAFNVGEKEIGPFKVDGNREITPGEKVACEFHGYFWHGCPKCFPRRLWTKYNFSKVNDCHMKLYGNVNLIRNVKLTKT